MLIYEDFAIRHKGMVDSSKGREIFGFLTKTENVNIMVAFNDLNMPALSGVARRPEQTFKDNKEFTLDNPRNRRVIGRMVTHILRKFGYTPSKSKSRVRNFAESKYFESASIYAKDTSVKPRYRLEIVEDAREEIDKTREE